MTRPMTPQPQPPSPTVSGTGTPLPLADDALPPGWGKWDLPAGWHREPHGGPGGTPALRLTRTNPAEYLKARLRFPLPAGERYRLAASICVEKPAGAASTLG